MKKILLMLLLLVVFVGGFFVRPLLTPSIPTCPLLSNPPPAGIIAVKPVDDSQPKADYQKGYDAGLEKAREIVVGMKCFQDTLQSNSHRITGVISSVTDPTLEIQLNASSLNPFLDGMIMKKVTVTDKTVIQKQLAKSDEEYQKEFLVYNSLIEKLKPSESDKEDLQIHPEKPQKYSMQILTFADLKIGQEVTVETVVDVNAQEDFDASTINLLPEGQPTQPKADLGVQQDLQK